MGVKDRAPLVMDDDGTHPWDRQSREAPGQFDMFSDYLEMTTRSAPALAKYLGKSVAYVSQCAWAGRWRDRAEQRDAFNRAERAATLEAERIAVQDQYLVLSRAMLAKAGEAIEILDPADMKAGDIARLVEAAAKLQRVVLDMPDQTVAVMGKAGAPPVALSVVTPLSEAQRVSRLSSIAAELARRSGQDGVDPTAFDAFLGDTAAG